MVIGGSGRLRDFDFAVESIMMSLHISAGPIEGSEIQKKQSYGSFCGLPEPVDAIGETLM